MKEREFDIVLMGATGFTGGLLAAELASESDLRWAVAGRSESKLTAVIEELGIDVPVIVADSHDAAALDEMTKRTHVVVSTVGPFYKHGLELVASCVRNGTHYCDSTGEPHFARAIIDAHHDDAVNAGIRLVPFCGFDSIPSDLGTFAVQDTLMRQTGGVSSRVDCQVRKFRAGASGGTINTMAEFFEEVRKNPEIRKVAASPYSLNPPDKRRGPRFSTPMGLGRHDGAWTAPFIMAIPNTKVVQRSHALLYPDAEPLNYQEYSAFRSGARGFARAAATAAGLGGATAALGTPGVRTVALSLLPSPGKGPSAEEMAKGGFLFVVSGENGGVRVTCDVRGNSDPGYSETAKMLAQSALCLAFDPLKTAGVLTPATAMGQHLIDRLHARGLTFDVKVV